jgi:4-amino-4-deoxy-L-arabinose transferase-like glycosyltransferase
LSRIVEAVRSKKDVGMLAILLAVLVARLGLAILVYVRPELALANDTDRYRPLADLIVSGTAYGWNTDHSGELANTVGYPLFLAAVYVILGHAPWQTAVAQLLLSGLLAMLIYLSLARSLGRLPALVGALVLLLDPLTALWSLTVLTETLFAFTVGVAALLMVRWTTDQRDLTLIETGCVLGLACLVKPFAQLIVVVWAAGLFLFPSAAAGSWRSRIAQRLRRALVFALPALLIVSPWVVRNTLLWNCPTLSSVDRITLRDYMAAKVVSEYEHTPLEQVQSRFQAADGGVCPSRTAEYLQIVVSHPMVYAKLQVAGTIPVLIATNFDRWFQFFGTDFALPDLWRPFMDGGLGQLITVLRDSFIAFPQGLVAMALLTAFQLVLYVLVLLALLAYRRLHDSALQWGVLMLVAAMLILVLTPGQGGNERFRVPAQPLFAILAAQGIAWSSLRSGERLEGRRS